MKTIAGNATVAPDGKLTIEVPPDVLPGEHRVIVMIDAQSAIDAEQGARGFPAHDVGPWPKGLSTRREDTRLV